MGNEQKSSMSISELYRPLDGLRGISAVIIGIVFHYQIVCTKNLAPLYPFMPVVCEYGWILVELFFLLSGLTFMTFYAKRISEEKISGLDFSVARFSRLYPIHLVTLIVVACVQVLRMMFGLGVFHGHVDGYHFVLNLFMLQRSGLETTDCFNVVAWTVSIEMLMYFVFFWLCRKCGKNSRIFVFGCLLCMFMGWVMQRSPLQFGFFNGNVGRGLVAFFWGCLLAKAYPFVNKRVQGHCLDVVSFFILVSAMISSHLIEWQEFGPQTLMVTPFTILVFPAAIYLVIHLDILRRLFQCRALKWLGGISYCLFMVHYPIQVCLIAISDLFQLYWKFQNVQVWLAYAMLCFCAAHLLHEYFEGPCSKKIRTFYQCYKKAKLTSVETGI